MNNSEVIEKIKNLILEREKVVEVHKPHAKAYKEKIEKMAELVEQSKADGKWEAMPPEFKKLWRTHNKANETAYRAERTFIDTTNGNIKKYKKMLAEFEEAIEKCPKENCFKDYGTTAKEVVENVASFSKLGSQ